MRKIICLILIVFVVFTVNLNVKADGNTPKSKIVTRLMGNDRYGTAVAISQYGWTGQADNVILAVGTDYPDSLCAIPLAAKLNAPILLTETNTLNPLSYKEIQRLSPKNIYIIGGTGVISDNIEKTITGLGIHVTRIAGQNRYETSAKVAQFIGSSETSFIVTGNNYPDAISVGTIAAKIKAPILLSDVNSLSDDIKKYIQDNSNSIKNTYVIGGPAVISNNAVSNLKNVHRIYGNDRYDTNILILNTFGRYLNFDTAFLSTGEDFPDALTGASAAQATSSPIILVNSSMNSTTKDLIHSNNIFINKVNLLGGDAVVSSSLLNEFNVYNGPNATKPLFTPTYDGSNEGCHPKVLYFDAGWNGYKYWMAFTPYPYGDDQYENPSILASNDGINWEVPTGVTNPIVAPPFIEKNHNSDPELVYNKNSNLLELWYRYTIDNQTDNILKIVSSDGVNWSKPQIMYSTNGGKECLSPAIIMENNTYKMWYVNENLQCMYTENSGNGWTEPTQVNLNLPGTYQPWHLDVVKTNKGYEALVSSFKTGEALLNNRVLFWGVSSDGLNFNNSSILLQPTVNTNNFDNKQIYRSTFVVVNGMYRVYYSAMDKNTHWHIGLTQGYDMTKLFGY